MADITEAEQWDTGVYQLETTDPVQGGADGVDNLPHKALANRTLWLKAQVALKALLGGSPTQTFKVADAVNDDEALSKGQLLVEMKAVDGSDSGLDADLLRGLPADFTSSLSENGYQKLPSGLIMQWGTFKGNDDANSSDNVVFPIAFPTACVLGVGNYNSTRADEYQATVDTLSTTSMNVSHNTGSLQMLWFAIGY